MNGDVLALLVSVGFGLIVATVIQLEMNRPKVDADRGWARRSNTDTRVVAAYLADITDQMRADTEAAKTRAAVETLLAAWQPVEGTPLRWSLEWLARNTDRTHT